MLGDERGTESVVDLIDDGDEIARELLELLVHETEQLSFEYFLRVRHETRQELVVGHDCGFGGGGGGILDLLAELLDFSLETLVALGGGFEFGLVLLTERLDLLGDNALKHLGIERGGC